MPAFTDNLAEDRRDHARTRRQHAAALLRLQALEGQAADIEDEAADRTAENPPTGAAATEEYRHLLIEHARTQSRFAHTLDQLAHLSPDKAEQTDALNRARQERTNSRENRQAALNLPSI